MSEYEPIRKEGREDSSEYGSSEEPGSERSSELREERRYEEVAFHVPRD